MAEIGIRAALGPPRQHVVAAAIGQGAMLVGLATEVGLAVALAAGPAIEPLRFKVSPRDLLVLGGGTAPLWIAVLAKAPGLASRPDEPSRGAPIE